MNFKNATLWAMLAWIFIFIEVSILMFTPFIASKLWLYYLLYYLISILLVGYCAYSYFKIEKKSSFKSGLIVGLWFVLIGSILDLVITIPFFVKSFSFYSQSSLWIGFGIGILTCGIIGSYLKKKIINH